MVVSARVRTPEVKERATERLDNIGLSVSDVMRIVPTRVAKEGALPAGLTVDVAARDAWSRAKVQEALDDPPRAYLMKKSSRISPGAAPRRGA
ncbi:type II toxin-antitoxin system RelB/DinJ family antitoxin [Variovorax sp. V15]|uniref:type II toxin-antitoxin system RelB/DinJ family antitoxin n=1 Tax=unclassified Variovorax TaxID=663243 RepID=UPI0034E8E788